MCFRSASMSAEDATILEVYSAQNGSKRLKQVAAGPTSILVKPR